MSSIGHKRCSRLDQASFKGLTFVSIAIRWSTYRLALLPAVITHHRSWLLLHVYINYAVIFSWPACEVYTWEDHHACICRIHVSLHAQARAICNSVYYFRSNCRLNGTFIHFQVEGSAWWKKARKTTSAIYRYRRVVVVTHDKCYISTPLNVQELLLHLESQNSISVLPALITVGPPSCITHTHTPDTSNTDPLPTLSCSPVLFQLMKLFTNLLTSADWSFCQDWRGVVSEVSWIKKNKQRINAVNFSQY